VNREGELLVVPHTYAREHMQLAYASTVHAAQGATVDVGYAVPDGAAGAEDLYVMATRGRLTNAVYVSTGVEGADHDRPSGRAALADMLQRSDEEAKAATTVLVGPPTARANASPSSVRCTTPSGNAHSPRV